jgi:hypothetical protein
VGDSPIRSVGGIRGFVRGQGRREGIGYGMCGSGTIERATGTVAQGIGGIEHGPGVDVAGS